MSVRTLNWSRALPGLLPRLRAGGMLPWLLLIVVAVSTLTPVLAALLSAFRSAAPGQAGDWTLDGLARALSESSTWEALWTTYWLSAVRALMGVGLAVVITWIVARTDCPFRLQLESLIVLAYFFPGLGRILGWVLLASPRTGVVNGALRLLPGLDQLQQGPFNVYSYAGVIYVSVIGFSAFFVVFLLPAFRAMDASLEESARMCGASERKTLWYITVPLLRPAIAGILVLSVMLLLSSFEIEVFLGTPAGVYVLTNQIYHHLQEVLPADYGTAFSLSLLLLLSALSLVFVYGRVLGQRDYTTVSGRSFSTRVTHLGRWRWVAFAFVSGYLLLSLILPAIALVYASVAKTAGANLFSADGYTLNNWASILSLQLPRQSVGNTFVLSITAATVGGVFGTIIAYVLVRTKFAGNKLLEFSSWIPWTVPTIVLGLGLLWVTLFTPLSVLYGSLAILVVAHVIRGIPIRTRIMTSTLVQIDTGLEEAARVHGANWLRTFWHIWLPLLRTGFVAGWIIGFVFSFSELALVAFLYGPKSMVLSTLMFSLWSREPERAAVVGIITTVIIMFVVGVVRRITRTQLQPGAL
ncbi:MAG: iron ABC transporter permease [Chloroflexi bacterium]|nr:iron ABC transporter permease [Chloroflexota bacterium]